MSFGSGIGGLVGGMLAHSDTQDTFNNVNGIASTFTGVSQPYNSFGQSFLTPTTNAINTATTAAGNTMGYEDFMKNYTTTPGVEYQREQARDVQNNTAAARGGVLSGANNRALATIDNGIIATGANAAYDEYLKGSNTQFGQLEAALGNMFSAIGVGTTATGQQAGVANTQMSANASLAATQAKNDAAKGSGIGDIFGGLRAFKF